MNELLKVNAKWIPDEGSMRKIEKKSGQTEVKIGLNTMPQRNKKKTQTTKLTPVTETQSHIMKAKKEWKICQIADINCT